MTVRQENGSLSFVSFMRRVGIVAGALIAVISLGSAIASFAWSNATRPIMTAIAQEHDSRVQGEDRLANAIQQMTEERIDLLDVMRFKPGSPERDLTIARLRRKWTRHREEQ